MIVVARKPISQRFVAESELATMVLSCNRYSVNLPVPAAGCVAVVDVPVVETGAVGSPGRSRTVRDCTETAGVVASSEQLVKATNDNAAIQRVFLSESIIETE
jgi:hypothetical protein